ncbi:MAG TPA: hypothetical protein VIA06_13070 [Candidatus Dormibacteraeota bacterium]|nr:hypothetical protein [Candidatus Dormibacteraeota bacterium]
MHSYWWIIVAVVVVALIVAAVAVILQRQRSARLRQQFGPEYERAVEQTGGTGAAERALRQRQDRRREFEIRPLRPAERERFETQWHSVQAAFVDAPGKAVAEADHLISAVMTERGYPMREFDDMADDASVDHPREVQDYRAAHEVAMGGGRGDATTEDLREAMQRYRSLFASLVEEGGTPSDAEAPPADAERRS